jgi:hypothetical protein
MAVTVAENIGFITVSGRLEPKALAASIAVDAHTRVGEIVSLVDDWLREEDWSLTQRQKMELMTTALRCMDGFERATLETLLEDLGKIRTDA